MGPFPAGACSVGSCRRSAAGLIQGALQPGQFLRQLIALGLRTLGLSTRCAAPGCAVAEDIARPCSWQLAGAGSMQWPGMRAGRARPGRQQMQCQEAAGSSTGVTWGPVHPHPPAGAGVTWRSRAIFCRRMMVASLSSSASLASSLSACAACSLAAVSCSPCSARCSLAETATSFCPAASAPASACCAVACASRSWDSICFCSTWPSVTPALARLKTWTLDPRLLTGLA